MTIYAASIAYRKNGDLGHALSFISSPSADEARGALQRRYQEDGAEIASLLIEAVPESSETGEKAPPIGRNISFTLEDPEFGNAVVYPDEPEGPYWTLIAQGGDGRQNAVAAEICRRLNAAATSETAGGTE